VKVSFAFIFSSRGLSTNTKVKLLRKKVESDDFLKVGIVYKRTAANRPPLRLAYSLSQGEFGLALLSRC